MAEELQLEQLFRSCDKQNSGRIGPSEFRDLCAGFDIGLSDSDTIFTDLDHDGDGEVSLEDFAWGFRDFLTPGSRRGSMQVGRRSGPQVDEDYVKLQEDRDRRHSQARLAWSHLVAGVGEINVTKFLNTSGKKLEELYEELQATDTSPHLVTHFEGALSSLLQDVKKLHEDNKLLEDMFSREKEAHLLHLQSLEEELDAQVARVEAQVQEEARFKFEAEKRNLEERMETETAELQAHLRLFQKLNTILTRGRTEGHESQMSELKRETASVNLELRSTLADTRTNLAVLRSEMAQLRSEYEQKCRQLNSQQETMVAYMHQNDHVHRQLHLLHEANTKLQDTNDSLLTVIDVSGLHSPRPSSPWHHSHTNSTGSTAEPSDQHKINKISQPTSISSSEVGSYVDSAPASISLSPSHADDVQFGIQRLMKDLVNVSVLVDGRIIMGDSVNIDSDMSLQEELLNVKHTLGSDLDSDLDSRHIDELDSGIIVTSNRSRKSKSLMNSPIFRKKVISPGNSIEIPRLPLTITSFDPTGAPDRTYKIVFAGDAAVGKSCFIFRFCRGLFINSLGSTLGVDFQVKTIRVDGRNVALQLWDTAGQERFRSMTKTYFRKADGVMLLYDVTNERSFLNVRQWMQSINDVTENRIPIIICGNKVDLRHDALKEGISCVDTAAGEDLAQHHGAIFFETSSKSGTNIFDAVLTISREMLTREDAEVQTSCLQIAEEEDRNMITSCCSSKMKK